MDPGQTNQQCSSEDITGRSLGSQKAQNGHSGQAEEILSQRKCGLPTGQVCGLINAGE